MMLSDEMETSMRHALGQNNPRGPANYRNYYAAAVGSPTELMWDALVGAGFAERIDGPVDGLVGFRVTDAGRRELDASPRPPAPS